ncbi:ClbS/DfsB family four-helix bundle protein [uncultured Enterococcus sp.]|uniref:ClbS/DfsB family four-helix bundle protein n=1 Tax=uncultured Enterococcus sp. TaxID=167972 RepID=UPI0025883346|nr:ClbS/DfsB family four-helix bundle protein [uncultured Enterococcus sp.]
MGRPTIKKELIQAGTDTYEKMNALLETIPEEKLMSTFQFDAENEKQAHWTRDKNLRDVLIHLYEWHQLLLNWVTANQAGEAKQFLKEGYNWKNYGAMNVEFWEKHQTTSYETARRLLTESHKQVMALADTFSNEELFSKGSFSWVGGSTLGSYFVSATASHYEWAMKKIRKFKKSL